MLVRLNRGDTLIEVLFAVTIFSLIAVGALAIMNQGTASSQRALEITLVRQQVDSQAETLRFLNNSYVAAYNAGSTYALTTPAGQWSKMVTSIPSGVTQASNFGSDGVCPTTTMPNGSFILDTKNAQFIAPSQDKLKPAVSFSQLEYNETGATPVLSAAEGIWIEAVRSATNTTDVHQSNIGYIDFHIRACWYSMGQATPISIGTIVRLYEPR